MKKKYSKEELEEMKADLQWEEYHAYLESKEYTQEQETQTDNRVHGIPEWLNINLSEDEKTKLKEEYPFDYLDVQNPYRRQSKVNLTKEKNNFRWIETEVLKSLMSSRITGSEWSVLFYIIHRTRGYRLKGKLYKPVETIKTREIQEWTELSTPNLYRTLKSLIEKRIIYEVGCSPKGSHKLGVNFRYDTWKLN